MSLDGLKWTIARYFESIGEPLPADLPAVLGPYQGDIACGQPRTVVGGHVEFWDAGVIVVEPDVPAGKDVVISCGVHGNETAPIEMVRDLLQEILSSQLVVRQRVLLLIANPLAIVAGTRFVHTNMNRLFSGAHRTGSSLEHQRAAQLEQYVSRFYRQQKRYHYDLHTAIRDSAFERFAIYPFPHDNPYCKEQLTFLAECGINTILLNQAPTTTFSYYSVNTHQAHGFTVELGKVKPFGQNDMSRFAAAANMLRQLISCDELKLPEFDPNRHQIFDVNRTINRETDSFELHFSEDVPNFTEFEVGYVLATDGAIKHRVEQPGERIIFPNAQVEKGQRALLLVKPIAIEQLKLV